MSLLTLSRNVTSHPPHLRDQTCQFVSHGVRDGTVRSNILQIIFQSRQFLSYFPEFFFESFDVRWQRLVPGQTAGIQEGSIEFQVVGGLDDEVRFGGVAVLPDVQAKFRREGEESRGRWRRLRVCIVHCDAGVSLFPDFLFLEVEV